MRSFFIQRSTQGFTLVETLVAISILLLVIVGPMTVAQKGIQNAYFAREQLTAVFLAQEAVEAVRELRDNAALDEYHNQSSGGNTWSWISLVSGCASGSGCGLSGAGGTFATCNGTSCRLKISSTGQYGSSGSDYSPYTRIVKITQSIPGVAALVEVDVTWSTNLFSTGGLRSVKLNTWIYDHYQRFEN